ncbi:ABC transporter substrate-binding protein [Methylobacterium organophilum]|uniref:Riboflavin-binding protein RibY n=1 Tax=Methylobacterium organophilum TaxID=410 RepID=A0ABQ4TEE5_METOR|nr:ABC transporter substrate-binding protein [Methylobacterium organophilum]UMY18599.1 ABC transporter substrate-binding protein [Methylobacterium organophilum]GJE29456.1 Riboflavin-binding protein RibY [Methylobacterium organophilum]
MTPSLTRLAAAFGLTLALTGAATAEPLTFLIDWLPAGDKAAIYLGVEKGLFKEQGLEVTVQSGRGSSDVVTKLGTGAADMGTGGLAALLQAKAQSGVPVTAVMAIYTKQPDAIFTTTDSGVSSLKDLVGKTIATATFSSSNVAWPLVLKANGVPADGIKVLKVDPGALAPMLAAGKVAATINWLTVAPAFQGPLKEAGKAFKALPWSEFGYEGYGLSVFASDKMIAQRPEAVRKFLAAYAKATEMANADPAAAAQALKSAVPEVEVERAAQEWKASIPLIDNAVSKKDGLGVYEPGLLKTTWKWVAESQGIPVESFDPGKAVTGAFLPTMKKAER